jgi:hypothetical protein
MDNFIFFYSAEVKIMAWKPIIPGCMAVVLQWFDEMLQQVNPFAKAYKQMYWINWNVWINKWNALIFN